MPRLIPEQDAHVGDLQRRAESKLTSEDGRTSVAFTRELYEVQRRAARPLAVLGRMPFASGMLIANLPLPGVRGRVASVSGNELTLANPETAALFARYDANTPPRGSIVAVSAFEGIGWRGTTTLAAVDRTNGILFAETDWSAAIPGIAEGDWLTDSRELLPPERVLDAKGRPTGDYTGASVVRVTANFVGGPTGGRGASGVLVLRSQIQPAELVWLGATNSGRHVQLGSRYACIADLWVF